MPSWLRREDSSDLTTVPPARVGRSYCSECLSDCPASAHLRGPRVLLTEPHHRHQMAWVGTQPRLCLTISLGQVLLSEPPYFLVCEMVPKPRPCGAADSRDEITQHSARCG